MPLIDVSMHQKWWFLVLIHLMTREKSETFQDLTNYLSEPVKEKLSPIAFFATWLVHHYTA